MNPPPPQDNKGEDWVTWRLFQIEVIITICEVDLEEQLKQHIWIVISRSNTTLFAIQKKIFIHND